MADGLVIWSKDPRLDSDTPGTLGTSLSLLDGVPALWWVLWLSVASHGRSGFSMLPLGRCHSDAAAAKSCQSCPTLCDPIDSSPPGSPVPGILQARTLEWVAISFSNAGKWKVKVQSLSRVRLFATPWTIAYQAPPAMGFPRQEYWSGLPLPSPFTLMGYCWIFTFPSELSQRPALLTSPQSGQWSPITRPDSQPENQPIPKNFVGLGDRLRYPHKMGHFLKSILKSNI